MTVSNLVRKELYQMRWIMIIGLLFCTGLAVILAITFNYLEQIVEEIPVEIMELFTNYEVARELLAIFGNYSLYVWSQWNAKNLYQVGALFAIIIAAIQFAGEVSRRTIGFYLTRPISRWQGFLAKAAAGSLILLIIFGGGTIIIWAASIIIGQSADWGRLFAALVVSLVWLNVYYLVGCIISTLSREPITAGVIIGLVGIGLSLPGLLP